MTLKDKIITYNHLYDAFQTVAESIADELSDILEKYIPGIECSFDLRDKIYTICFYAHNRYETEERNVSLKDVIQYSVDALFSDNRLNIDTPYHGIWITEDEANAIEKELMELLRG